MMCSTPFTGICASKISVTSGKSRIRASFFVKTATEVGVRAIQDHKVIEWNTCWKCRLSEGTGDK